jgi:hypothetical protein
MINMIAEIKVMVWGLRKRAMICEPIITSRKEQQISAVAEPRATQKTYRGLAPANNNVVIWVLSPISERKTTPRVVRKIRQSNKLVRIFFKYYAPQELE